MKLQGTCQISIFETEKSEVVEVIINEKYLR